VIVKPPLPIALYKEYTLFKLNNGSSNIQEFVRSCGVKSFSYTQQLEDEHYHLGPYSMSEEDYTWFLLRWS